MLGLPDAIVVALLGLAGVVVTALAGVWSTRIANRRRQQAETEMRLQSATLSFADYVSEWAELSAELAALVEDTEIDRFLILRAWNGTSAPRWTTAIYQFRQGAQQPVSYVHFELDGDYVARLSAIVAHGHQVLDVAQLPESAIKAVYEAEGVRHSAWFFLDRRALEHNPDCQAITYCSFATHGAEPIGAATITRCRILTGRLKALAAR